MSAYNLPDLPHDYTALEPYFDVRTMELHHAQHHRRYIDQLNAALSAPANLRSVGEQSIDDLLWDIGKVSEESRNAVRHYGGGHASHSLHWAILSKDGGGKPSGLLTEAITEEFGSFTAFRERFSGVATCSLRQRLDMAGTGPQPLGGLQPSQRGLPAHRGRDPDPRARPVGARLLPAVPLTCRLRRGILERRELGRGKPSVRGGDAVIAPTSYPQPVASERVHEHESRARETQSRQVASPTRAPRRSPHCVASGKHKIRQALASRRHVATQRRARAWKPSAARAWPTTSRHRARPTHRWTATSAPRGRRSLSARTS
jgi:Iron/manganese superoxide dismutases, alpha-hairpin domain